MDGHNRHNRFPATRIHDGIIVSSGFEIYSGGDDVNIAIIIKIYHLQQLKIFNRWCCIVGMILMWIEQ